ncbi:hypothetical protein CF160_03850 [Enterococcus pseudoavium]|nr:hypothetical protein CF160_03850 [Enterococcus pseudoavium]
MKVLRILLHLIQIGLLYAIYLMDDLYRNHLGFMRNVSFYFHKFEASAFGSKLFLLPLGLLVIAIFLWISKKNFEAGLLVIVNLLFLSWQLFFDLQTTPIYFLISGIFCLLCLVQLIIVLMKGK